MSDSLQNNLYVKLQELIAIQSEGEWDDLLIQKDARKFTVELMPLFAALEAERDALRADAERWRMLPAFLEDYQVPYLGLSRDIDAAIAAKEPK